MLAQADGGVSLVLCVSVWAGDKRTLWPVTWWWATHLRRTTRSVPMADQHRWGHESVRVSMCGSSTPRHSFSLNTQTKFVRAHTTDSLPPWGKMSDQTWRWTKSPPELRSFAHVCIHTWGMTAKLAFLHPPSNWPNKPELITSAADNVARRCLPFRNTLTLLGSPTNWREKDEKGSGRVRFRCPSCPGQLLITLACQLSGMITAVGLRLGLASRWPNLTKHESHVCYVSAYLTNVFLSAVHHIEWTKNKKCCQIFICSMQMHKTGLWNCLEEKSK